MHIFFHSYRSVSCYPGSTDNVEVHLKIEPSTCYVVTLSAYIAAINVINYF